MVAAHPAMCACDNCRAVCWVDCPGGDGRCAPPTASRSKLPSKADVETALRAKYGPPPDAPGAGRVRLMIVHRADGEPRGMRVQHVVFADEAATVSALDDLKKAAGVFMILRWVEGEIWRPV